MDTPNAARVDTAALRSISRQYDIAADLVDAAARNLTRLTFDGSVAGHQHVARGDAVHSRLSGLAGGLRHWSRTAAEVAAMLRACADRYAAADQRGAGRMS